MKQKQLEQVLLILGSSHKHIKRLVNLPSNVTLEVRYNSSNALPLVSEWNVISHKEIRSTSGAIYDQFIERVAVSDLKYALYPHTLDKRCGRDNAIQIKFDNQWFYLLVAPLKSGPACFVDHVVL